MSRVLIVDMCEPIVQVRLKHIPDLIIYLLYRLLWFLSLLGGFPLVIGSFKYLLIHGLHMVMYGLPLYILCPRSFSIRGFRVYVSENYIYPCSVFRVCVSESCICPCSVFRVCVSESCIRPCSVFRDEERNQDVRGRVAYLARSTLRIK